MTLKSFCASHSRQATDITRSAAHPPRTIALRSDQQVARHLNDRTPRFSAGLVGDDGDPGQILIGLRQAGPEPLEKLEAHALLARFVIGTKCVDVKEVKVARTMLTGDGDGLLDDGRRGLGVVDGREDVDA